MNDGADIKQPRSDCFHFRGEIPCIKKKVCWDCGEFAPIPRRALIIKFGAAGDALRTTPIIERLRKEGYGEIVWICDEASIEVLSFARSIDRLMLFGAPALALLQHEHFDTVFSFDKNPAAAAAAMLAKSSDKRGFGLSEAGKLIALDDNAHYALRLGMDDELKFKENRKTVPELIFEMAGYEYAREEYDFTLSTAVEKNLDAVALNIGVGARWPTKAWPGENWVKLAMLLKDAGMKPVFVGGESERWILQDYAARARVESIPPSELGIFAETLAMAGTVVSCDSLGVHVALAVKTRTIGLFCSTCAAEIEWFGRGEALSSDKGPCYNSKCSNWPGCMSSITPERVMERIEADMAR